MRPKSFKNKVFGHYGVVYDKQGAVSDYVFKDGETIVDFAAGSLERNLGTLIVSATINYGVEAVQEEYGPMLKSESSQEYISEFIKQELLRSQGASREIIEIVKTHGDYTGSGERIVRFFEKLAGKVGDQMRDLLGDNMHKAVTGISLLIAPAVCMLSMGDSTSLINMGNSFGATPAGLVISMQLAASYGFFMSIGGGPELVMLMAARLERISLNTEFKPKMKQAILADCASLATSDWSEALAVYRRFGEESQRMKSSSPHASIPRASQPGFNHTTTGILYDATFQIFKEFYGSATSEAAKERIEQIAKPILGLLDGGLR